MEAGLFWMKVMYVLMFDLPKRAGAQLIRLANWICTSPRSFPGVNKYGKMLETLCVYLEPEGAVCVRVMFNNYYDNFLKDTPQIRPEKKKRFLILWVCLNWNSL